MIHSIGGYKTITPIQIANLLAALAEDTITLRSFRVFLGSLELKAIREAANRVKKAKGKGKGQERYEKSELTRLVPDLSERAITSELRRLTRAKLLSFRAGVLELSHELLPEAEAVLEALNGSRSSTRPIPIPRRGLRFLCRCRKPSLIKTLLAYFVRGLSFNRKSGELRTAGTVKASWISRAFDLSERAVRGARAELISLGFISKDETSHQRKLNRDGSYFRLTLSWDRGEPQTNRDSHSTDLPLTLTAQKPDRQCGGEGRVIHDETPQSLVVGNSGGFAAPSRAVEGIKKGLEFAPPQAKNGGEFAPLKEILRTLSDLKNQKLVPSEPTGVWGKEGRPNLRNIRPEDIRKPSRLRELYEQATKAGWLERSEANFLNFAAAAVRANRASGDSVRIFVGIVKRKLWGHISQAEEGRARQLLISN